MSEVLVTLGILIGSGVIVTATAFSAKEPEVQVEPEMKKVTVRSYQRVVR